MNVSIIVSVYNEDVGIINFYKNIIAYLQDLKNNFEIVFVNDGSTDNTKKYLEEIFQKEKNTNSNVKIKIINFSKNFGHEAAMLAGLDNAKYEYYIFMDSDLQHPINKINDIIKEFENKKNVVLMVRKSNKQAGLIKNFFSAMFYYLINKISNTHFEVGASDYFAFDAKVAKVLKNDYREKVRFLRGFVQNVGFNTAVIEYDADRREIGKSHYNFHKLLDLSINSILCFSNAPLKIAEYAGIFSAVLGFVVLVYTLITRKGSPSGYATIVILLCFMFAILFILIGIIGEYIGILFVEMKNRPIYIIDEIEEVKNKEKI